MIGLDTRIEAVLGKPQRGPKGAKFHKGLDRLGLVTVGDLMAHYPRRYVDTAQLTRVTELHHRQLLTLVGEIGGFERISYRDKRTGRPAYRVQVELRTGGTSLQMTFFAAHANAADYYERRFPRGRRGLFVGSVTKFRDQWQLTNPRSVMFGSSAADTDDDRAESATVRDLYPIYPLTSGVESWDLYRAATFALTILDEFPTLIPASVRAEFELCDADDAHRWVHAPDDRHQVALAHRHFRFEEALVTQLVLGRRRREQRALGAVSRRGERGGLLAAFDAALPFTLTDGQVRVGAEIDADLAAGHPMNRLLQGEVGSGKTLVALRAMLRVIDSGGQAALLAPTEVLAQQHHRSITAMLGGVAGALGGGGVLGGTGVELLTGSMTKTQRKAPLSRLVTGESGLVIGTHALLEDTVMFADLGLVVVDEQHRFGVEQRAALTDKTRDRGAGRATPPHVLVMTATPIPRTVAMTVFGDLEVSTLDELPEGRAPVQTTVVNLLDHPTWVDRVWQRVREEVADGHQVFVVCPRITGDETEEGQPAEIPEPEPEDGEDGEPDGGSGDGSDGEPSAAAPQLVPPAAVEEVIASLTDSDVGPLAGLRVAPLHGRMAADDKDATMRAFADGDLDVLVSTTVVEVGVDVPNATAMVLLDADRFGVSQLHQLRGRVGRGGLPGLCLLVTRAEPETGARRRLAAVEATSDGFELSRVDLEERREGDVLGRSQSGGTSTLVTLRVLRDEETIIEARSAAESLLDADPSLAAHPRLRDAVVALETAAEADFIEKS